MKDEKPFSITIIGAGTTKYSNSIDYIVDALLVKITNHNLAVRFSIEYLLKEMDIRFCKNCKSCFNYNFCPLDKKDSFNTVKGKLLLSDLIIIATPVYEKNVSAFMKAFLDRLGYWCHLMPLAGKNCIIIVTAKYTGFDFVCEYLYEMCSQFGLNIVGVICKQSKKSEVRLLSEIEYVASNLIRTVFIEKKIYSNLYLENIYSSYRTIFLQNQQIGKNKYEYVYWQKFENAFTFQTVIDARNKIGTKNNTEKTITIEKAFEIAK